MPYKITLQVEFEKEKRESAPVFSTHCPLLLAFTLSIHPSPAFIAVALKSPVQSRIGPLPPVATLDRVVAHALALHGAVAEQELVRGAALLALALPLLVGGNHQPVLVAGTLSEREIAGSIQMQASPLQTSECQLT